MSVENYDYIRMLGNKDAEVLEEKGKTYGSSWRQRGGVGAFMMLARKWDRIENQCKELGYDIFRAIAERPEILDEDFLDDLRDLRRYLFLVDAHCTCSQLKKPPVKGADVVYHEDSNVPVPEKFQNY